eukprot:536388-Pleurochrysis_carterae.AAC.1
MMYKWGHPVTTLPSDGGDYTSPSLSDVNYANQLPGHWAWQEECCALFASQLVEALVVLMPAVRAKALAAPAEPELGPGL